VFFLKKVLFASFTLRSLLKTLQITLNREGRADNKLTRAVSWNRREQWREK